MITRLVYHDCLIMSTPFSIFFKLFFCAPVWSAFLFTVIIINDLP
uniref:Uncharacterized protein n=1 Tax=Siphoviridae sp. ctMgg26 TaxID=2825462 RepID=A0A8S5Q0U2_9CAUD|nr:MAG TPA: hypothetical protein [Siphoviridae sp. ctMgg26]